jgi:N4-(beta-N-acetylglucosaminyl)-L-asparaginase
MDNVNRRDFIKSIAAAGALAGVPAQAAESGGQGPVFLATWKHGMPAINRAAVVFHQGGSLLDAIEKGINVTEEDPTVTTVGYGGLPNAEGIVELDAGIMDGTRHRAGAICGLRGVKTPISVARLVLEKTTHTTIGGIGLQEFAQKMGFQFEQLLTPNSLKQWMEWKADPHHKTYWISPENHDTIGMVATDGKGHIAAGCSTSGMAWKIPGRVADSPLVGCGFYADDLAGGASATGDGDLMTNYCTSVTIVHMMARGASPQEACEELLRNMVKTEARNKESEAAVIAMNTRGEIGAASMNTKMHLQYALWKDGGSRLLESKDVY